MLHPTDLSAAAERAFDHALAIAIRHGADFTLLHPVGRRATDNWPDFPSVRSKLARWRRAGTLGGLGRRIRQTSVSKVDVQIRDPVAASVRYIARHPVHMIVQATEGRSGLARIIRASTAERLARETKLFTLFVPAHGRGFVDGRTGAVSLRRIVVPIDSATDPKPAMLRAVHSAALLENPELEITLLHIGEGEEMHRTDVPDLPYCRWNAIQRNGPVVEQILRVTDELEADAIFMSTTWSRSGFGRSGHDVTEGVLEGAVCPVATVPVTAR